MNEGTRLNFEEYKFLREEIRHEDGLLSQRVSWLVSSQSFLLTGLAISLNSPTVFRSTGYSETNRLMTELLPWCGLICVGLCFVTMLASVRHMDHIRELSRGRHPGNLPEVQGRPATRLMGLSGPLLLPLLFAVLWVLVLVQMGRH